MLIFSRRKTRAISRDVVTNYQSSSITPHDQAFVLFQQSLFSMPSELLGLFFFFFFLQPSNYSALLQSFCISSQRLHHLNDEERESCACRSGSCTLQSQPARGWGSHNDQSPRSFTDWLLKQGQPHCLGKSHGLCFFVTPERGNIHRLFGKGKCGHWHFGCTRGFSVRSLKDLTPQLSLAWHLNQRSW